MALVQRGLGLPLGTAAVVVRGVLRAVSRPSWRGLEHLPDGGCVIAANHVSWLDPVTLADVLADGQPLEDGFTIVWPDATRPGVLLPGESVVVTRETVITDAQAGRAIGGSATVGGVGATTGANASDAATTSIQLPSLPVEPEPSPEPSQPGTSPQRMVRAIRSPERPRRIVRTSAVGAML